MSTPFEAKAHPTAETSQPVSTPLRSPILQRALAAFTYRDFRVLWVGAFTSTVGTWMQKVAQSWLVLQLTGSTLYLGLDDFLGQLPILLFTLLGGVIADRHDRKRLLIGSQFVQMATAFALAALVYQGRVHVAHILALSFTAGLAQSFGGPAYQALVPSLVHKKDLPNAIALNSTQFNLARVFGPLAAGVTMATLGATGCFSLNGISFLIVIVALMSLSVTHTPPTDRKPILHELKSGIAYARSEPTIIALTVLASMTTFLAIILGTSLGGLLFSAFRGELWRMGLILVAVAVAGLATSLRISRVPASATRSLEVRRGRRRLFASELCTFPVSKGRRCRRTTSPRAGSPSLRNWTLLWPAPDIRAVRNRPGYSGRPFSASLCSS